MSPLTHIHVVNLKDDEECNCGLTGKKIRESGLKQVTYERDKDEHSGEGSEERTQGS